MKRNTLHIKNLSIGYPQKKGMPPLLVGKTINAQLTGGEMVCLLGANGVGKSTLMKTITGFLPALDGSVTLNGKSIHTMNERAISKLIAVVLTDKLEVTNATVFEMVSYGRSPYTGFMGRLSTEDKKSVNKALQVCGIAHKTQHLFSSLSDGERQKVTIAKALAQDTPIIILDEPTAFLDLPSKVEIMQLLRSLSAKVGKSILMSTHDLDLALQMADKLWLVDAEKPLTTGTPEDLLLNNAFQSLFENSGIIFDYKTGLFKVNYDTNKTLGVQGHGFEFVMLRRAFSRNGIALNHEITDGEHWIDIRKDHKQPFLFMKNKEVLLETHSVEEVMTRYFEVCN